MVSFTEGDLADFELLLRHWAYTQSQIFTEVHEVEFEDLSGPHNPQRSCPFCPFKAVCGKDILWHTLS